MLINKIVHLFTRRTKRASLGVFFFILCFVAVGLFAPAVTHAATFYVNNSLGTDDVSHGTAIDGDAWATLKYALTGSRVSEGDTIYLQAGTWSEDQINVAVGAGSGAVNVESYNDDTVVIQTGGS